MGARWLAFDVRGQAKQVDSLKIIAAKSFVGRRRWLCTTPRRGLPVFTRGLEQKTKLNREILKTAEKDREVAAVGRLQGWRGG